MGICAYMTPHIAPGDYVSSGTHKTQETLTTLDIHEQE